METANSKRKFFEKPGSGSVVVSIAILALTVAYGFYRERQVTLKIEAARSTQAQAEKQAYLDGIERAAKDMLQQGVPESKVIDDTANMFRQNGATESEIDALKKRLSTSVIEKK